jgi:hypothetical protein
MSTPLRLFLAAALLAAVASVGFAQAISDEEASKAAVVESATEASSLATQIADTAYTTTADTKAVENFQATADEAASLLQQIASESSNGKRITATDPLFRRTAALALDGLRMMREGSVKIDLAVAKEFAQQFRELERQAYSSGTDTAISPPATETPVDAVAEPVAP